MGFTEKDIFITPPLVSRHQLIDGQRISGTAILSFNKKRGSWGWRAASISIINAPKDFSELLIRTEGAGQDVRP